MFLHVQSTVRCGIVFVAPQKTCISFDFQIIKYKVLYLGHLPFILFLDEKCDFYVSKIMKCVLYEQMFM